MLYAAAILVVGGAEVFDIQRSDAADRPISLLVGSLLAATFALSLGAMCATSWRVFRNRDALIDWRKFLLIVWLFPYLGVAVFLGGSNLYRFAATHFSGASA